MPEKKQEKVILRRRSRYGEETVLRRVPRSVVPLLDCLLDKMARHAQNDPRKTLERVAVAVQRIAAEEQQKDDAELTKLRNLPKDT